MLTLFGMLAFLIVLVWAVLGAAAIVGCVVLLVLNALFGDRRP